MGNILVTFALGAVALLGFGALRLPWIRVRMGERVRIACVLCLGVLSLLTIAQGLRDLKVLAAEAREAHVVAMGRAVDVDYICASRSHWTPDVIMLCGKIRELRAGKE